MSFLRFRRDVKKTAMFLSVFLVFVQTARAGTVTPSFNEAFIGTWKGMAPTKNLCSGGKLNEKGEREINFTIEKPMMKPGENYTVIMKARWGCFSEMTLSGFIFGDEYWASSDDKMTFVRLKMNKQGKVSGDLRFDLDNHTLAMSFAGFQRTKK